MRIGSQHYLKWIPAQEILQRGLSYFGFNECCLWTVERGQVTGLTLSSGASVDPQFFSRLQRRFAGFQGDIHLCLPPARFEEVKSVLEGLSLNLKVETTPFFKVEVVDQRVQVRSHLRLVTVDDSPTIQKMLRHLMSSAPGIELVEQVTDPLKVLSVVRRVRPDVITLDMQMPERDGLGVTRELMLEEPLPIVLLSSLSREEGSLVFQALQAGAFDYVQKPSAEDRSEFQHLLPQTLGAAVRGFQKQRDLDQEKQSRASTGAKSPLPKSSGLGRSSWMEGVEPKSLLWALGSSTGGTQALTEILTALPAEIPPTLIVQHIPAVFSKSFADLVNALCPFEVREAQDGDPLRSNCVFIAPGGKQMRLRKQTAGGWCIEVNDDPPVNRFKPSVDYLFNHLSGLKGFEMVAGILTGMGRDGAQGLLSLREAGTQTFAQDESTSVVYGMPRAAVEIGAAEAIVPLSQVAHHLIEVSRRKTAGKKPA